MTMTIRATYEKGVLRPAQSLALSEGESVELIITPDLRPTQTDAQLSEEELIRRIKACKSIREWIEVTKLFPPDEGDYDILKALNENRRLSGEMPLTPDEPTP